MDIWICILQKRDLFQEMYAQMLKNPPAKKQTTGKIIETNHPKKSTLKKSIHPSIYILPSIYIDTSIYPSIYRHTSTPINPLTTSTKLIDNNLPVFSLRNNPNQQKNNVIKSTQHFNSFSFQKIVLHRILFLCINSFLLFSFISIL